jgi:cytoskeletal protein CcmA (bactofilin family)
MGNRVLPRVMVAAGLFAFVAAMSVAPAFAQDDTGSTIGPQVVIQGRAIVAPGETAKGIVIVDGPVIVAGTVDGSVVAFHGRVTIAGTVDGDVVSVSDRVIVLAGAHITGDVRSRDRATVSPQAQVDGVVGNVDYSGVHDAIRVGRFIWWIGVTISTLVLGLLVLLVPGAADGSVRTAAGKTGASVGWGFILFFGLPLLAVLLMVVVVTLPLGLALLLALGLILMLGYTNSAWLLGRLLVRAPANRYLAFLAGFGILRVAALLPVAGGTVWTLASIFGLGVAAVAGWTARLGSREDQVVLVGPAAPVAGPEAGSPAPIPPPPAPTDSSPGG